MRGTNQSSNIFSAHFEIVKTFTLFVRSAPVEFRQKLPNIVEEPSFDDRNK